MTTQTTRLLTGRVTWIEQDGDETEIEVDGTWIRVRGPCPDLRGHDVTVLYREEGPALVAISIHGRVEGGEHQVLWEAPARTMRCGVR